MVMRARKWNFGLGASFQVLIFIFDVRWNHFTNAELKDNHDDLLRAEVGLPHISFVFQYISH